MRAVDVVASITRGSPRIAGRRRAAHGAGLLPAEDDTRPSGVPVHSDAAPVAFGAIVGALGGIAFGFVAGPIGMLIGGLLGAVGGAGAGDAVSKIEEHHTLHEEIFDEEIGIIDGNLGAASPDQPPAWIGAYSMASAGVSGGYFDIAPDEGPIPKAD